MRKSTAKLKGVLKKTNNPVATQQINKVIGTMHRIEKVKMDVMGGYADKAAFGKAMRPLGKRMLRDFSEAIKKINALIPKIRSAKEKKILKKTGMDCTLAEMVYIIVGHRLCSAS